MMTEEEYALFKILMDKEFGIVLKGDGRMTLHAKLSPRLTRLNLTSYRDYYDLVTSNPSGDELSNFISQVTNNETYFLREKGGIALFGSFLNEVKRYRQKKDQKRVTVISAGCSTGEEAYTLSITLIESGLFAWGWDVRIVGVDVNSAALKKARNAVYKEDSFRGLRGDEEFPQKYFDREDGVYVLKRPYRSRVEFRHGNILDPHALDGTGDIDVIFCRNVFIYMSDAAVRCIAENFCSRLADDGYLVIGSAESLLNKTELFIPEHKGGSIVYRKNLRPSLRRRWGE